eukprot:CAMPEP_0116033606 /NCGR_PEP_ID=MMETSP0321-20121206/19104_1 /TAXON_ID=163516 /ORGANISM="Leptocylindrus danicus var. danicus, Strain B650" /LENGTH=176 /DNA_ID=CAMNT_0003509743 /DNA_START=69 /DNA_END=599 /DNA_ORIENTATION=+
MSQTNALATPNKARQPATSNRRDVLSNSLKIIAATATATTAFLPRSAMADVSDGNSLPQGALQFSRALKAKSDWEEIAKSVKTRGAELSKDEWEGVMSYLRKLYTIGDDLKAISKGMDPSKKKEAERLISEFQASVKSADITARNKDVDAFLVLYQKSAANLDDFFGLLQDVPDEI